MAAARAPRVKRYSLLLRSLSDPPERPPTLHLFRALSSDERSERMLLSAGKSRTLRVCGFRSKRRVGRDERPKGKRSDGKARARDEGLITTLEKYLRARRYAFSTLARRPFILCRRSMQRTSSLFSVSFFVLPSRATRLAFHPLCFHDSNPLCPL